MGIEKNLFYPRVRQKIDDSKLMNEAWAEHDGAKDLIRQSGEQKPSDPMFDAKIKLLGEQIDHHVEKEEADMFPNAHKAGIDPGALGAELPAAKYKMRTGHGLPAMPA